MVVERDDVVCEPWLSERDVEEPCLMVTVAMARAFSTLGHRLLGALENSSNGLVAL